MTTSCRLSSSIILTTLYFTFIFQMYEHSREKQERGGNTERKTGRVEEMRRGNKERVGSGKEEKLGEGRKQAG